MPMPKDAYLKLIHELGDPETTVARRTEILLDISEDYETVWKEHDEFVSSGEQQTKQIQDLTHAYSVALRKTGASVLSHQQDEKIQLEAETITLDMIEGK